MKNTEVTKLAAQSNEQEAITLDESARLIALEKTIVDGHKVLTEAKQTYFEVGLALIEIRNNRLYRADYKTFAEYCRDKWGWDRTYCHRLIAGSQVVQMLPIGNREAITTESQARELEKIPAPMREAVVAAIVESGEPMTAAAIRAKAPAPRQTPPATEDPLPEIKPYSGRMGRREQTQWWYGRASKKQRGDFVVMLMASCHPVVVESKSQLRKRFEQFLANCTEATPAADDPR